MKKSNFPKIILSLSIFSLLITIASSNEKLGFAANDAEISSDQFLTSEAAVFFQKGDYQNALDEFEKLEKKFPNDPLVHRYKAISLDRLGRHDEALRIYTKMIEKDPTYLPARYFLAQTLLHSGQTMAARQELEWLATQTEESSYSVWAKEYLAQFEPAPADRVKRFFIQAGYGYEYDSNVILRPSDDSIRRDVDQSAGRQTLDLSLRYRAYTKRDAVVDLLYAVRQNFHDDSLNEFNFHSEEMGIDARKRIQVGNYDVVAGIRYDLLVGFLEDNIFSTRNRWLISADVRFTPRTRTVFYDRMTVSNFGPDGFDPSRTSRDGFYHDLGVTQYLYSSDYRSYVFLQEEFATSFTRGNNFDSRGSHTRLGGHMPLMEKLDLDTSVGLEFNHYSNFSSLSTRDLSKRRDINFDVLAALTYHITSEIGLRGFYRYIQAHNRNNFYDYDRQIGGIEVLYKKAI